MTRAKDVAIALFSVVVIAPAIADPAAPEAPPRETTAIVTARAESRRAWLGVFLGDALDGGVQLVAVAPGGPAAESGLEPGDVILQLGDRAVPDRRAMDAALGEVAPGEKVKVRFVRAGKVEDRVLTTAPRAPAWTFSFTTPAPEALANAAVQGLDLAGVHWIPIPDELRLMWGAPADAGVLVGDIEAGRPAAAAGLKVGDVVVRINDQPVATPGDIAVRLTPGSNALVVARKGVSSPVRIVLPEQPAPSAPSPPAREARARDAQIEQLQRELERLREEVQRLRAELERTRGSE